MKKILYFSIRFFLIISFLSSVFIFNSCGKKGCSNRVALNYISGVTKDDGTCIFNVDKLIGTWNVIHTSTQYGTTTCTATIARADETDNDHVTVSSTEIGDAWVAVNWADMTIEFRNPSYNIGKIINENKFSVDGTYTIGGPNPIDTFNYSFNR